DKNKATLGLPKKSHAPSSPDSLTPLPQTKVVRPPTPAALSHFHEPKPARTHQTPRRTPDAPPQAVLASVSKVPSLRVRVAKVRRARHRNTRYSLRHASNQKAAHPTKESVHPHHLNSRPTAQYHPAY